MNRVLDLTADVLQRVGDTFGRFPSDGDQHAYAYIDRSRSGSAFHRPLDKKNHKHRVYAAKHRDVGYGGANRYSSDNLAASPGYGSFQNYRQNPAPNPYGDRMDNPPYGTGIGGPLNYSSGSAGGYGSPYSRSESGMPYGAFSGNVGYAPDYYIAERRQVELVPAPRPRVIRQQVPVPYPVDRPVPQPYPVEVIRPVPVDRPFPVPVPSPVPYDRPVPYPVAVPVPVPSPPPPPICVPYPVAVPTPVACYVPVGIPVPSPRASPVMFEQSVTHRQRWVAGSPAMGMNPYQSYGNGLFFAG